jgi:3-carboxy-cis,cis-muconate cycloisomerase
MTIGILQSTLFGDMFGTAAMRAVFGEFAFLARCAEVEAALARAQARLGIVPEEAAAAISAAVDAVRASPDTLDLARLSRETETVGYPILPLVRQLAERAGAAGRWLHWGATTQDIMDTAVVLQVRDGLALVETNLSALRGHLAGLARRYRDTPMAGRTHLQHALPITFGYKAAVWLAAFDRHAARLAELKPRVLTVQFGGAAGTLASLGPGEASLGSLTELARELGLAEPAITWHVMRDAIAETVQFLALVGGSLAKIAFDVMLMAATEFGEVAEPFIAGRGSSSTMPQKRNPISCELILAAAKALRQHAGLILDAMVSDFERATGPWHVEWIAVPSQQSARRGWDNQAVPACFKHAHVIWTRSANSLQAGSTPSLHQRPDRWQHPTTRNNDPEVFPCLERGVHRWNPGTSPGMTIGGLWILLSRASASCRPRSAADAPSSAFRLAPPGRGRHARCRVPLRSIRTARGPRGSARSGLLAGRA